MSIRNKPEMNEAMLEKVAARFKVLSDPSRLMIVQALMNEPLCVGELVSQLKCSQPNVSKHLQQLYQSGIISRVKQGRQSYYEIADSSIYKLCDLMCKAVAKRVSDQQKSIQ